jgi:hypothetical protein
VDRDVVGQLLGAAAQDDRDPVDPPPVLAVQVGADDLAVAESHLDRAAHLDVLLEGDPEVVDGVVVLAHGGLAPGGDRVGERLGEGDEVGRLGDEVCLALELDQADGVGGGGDGDGALGVLTVRAVVGLT